MKKIQKTVQQISDQKGYSQQSLEQTFLLLTEEVGELAKTVRKSIGMKIGSHSKHQHVGEEVADVLYVFVDICNRLGIDMEKEFNNKLKIIRDRS